MFRSFDHSVIVFRDTDFSTRETLQRVPKSRDINKLRVKFYTLPLELRLISRAIEKSRIPIAANRRFDCTFGERISDLGISGAGTGEAAGGFATLVRELGTIKVDAGNAFTPVRLFRFSFRSDGIKDGTNRRFFGVPTNRLPQTVRKRREGKGDFSDATIENTR